MHSKLLHRMVFTLIVVFVVCLARTKHSTTSFGVNASLPLPNAGKAMVETFRLAAISIGPTIRGHVEVRRGQQLRRRRERGERQHEQRAAHPKHVSPRPDRSSKLTPHCPLRMYSAEWPVRIRTRDDKEARKPGMLLHRLAFSWLPDFFI